jgi:endonuclease III related protein
VASVIVQQRKKYPVSALLTKIRGPRGTIPEPGALYPEPVPAFRRLRRIYNRLVERFGPQQWWPASTAFEVVIGAYLTQNTAWKSVERSIANLQAHDFLSIQGIRAVPEPALRDLIRPSGFMIRKAAALKAFVAFLDAHYAGRMEPLRAAALADPNAVRAQLLSLPGVGPETADAILLYALDAPAMVVDEYFRRIAIRHRLAPHGANRSALQSLAEQAFAPERASGNAGELARHYNEFHALIVLIGKTHCGRTPRCDACPLAFDLPPSRLPVSVHKMKR